MPSRIALTVCCLLLLALGGSADEKSSPGAAVRPEDTSGEAKPMYKFAAVRYQVKDVDRSVEFYTKHLGFTEDTRIPPRTAFAAVMNGNLTIWLSGPKSSGARLMPDGRVQEPGGWNRIALEVNDLPSRVSELKQAGVRLRNEIEVGPGGKQIQIEDPDGNPIELFEPARDR